MKWHRLPAHQWFAGPFTPLWKRVAFHMVLAVLWAILIQFFLKDFNGIAILKTTCLIIVNDLVMTIGHTYLFMNLDLNFDWLKETYSRFFLGAIWHTLYSAVVFVLVQLVLFYWLFDMNSNDTLVWIGDHWWIPIGVTALVIVFTTTVGFFDNWKQSLIAEEAIRAEMMAYKFESLRSQVNPAFLFDNFHALKELILTDQQKSVRVIQKMSQLYRSVLESKDMELIPLEEELKQVDLYLELLQLKHGEALAVRMEIEPTNEDRVVPTALQNILQTFLARPNMGGESRITLKRSGSYLMVESDALHAVKENELEMASLKILEQRYQFFTDAPIKVTSNDAMLSIAIPILKEEL